MHRNMIYMSPTVVIIVKSRKLKKAAYVTKMVRKGTLENFWWGNLKNIHWEEWGDWKITLECISWK